MRSYISLRPFFIALSMVVVSLAGQAHALVISQVYGGGGNSGAPYTNDFIELFNNSATPFDLDGLSLQYATAAGSSWRATVLSGLVGPYGYYLVAEGTGSAGDGAALPDADAAGTINLSAINGKVALVDGTDPLTATCPATSLLDLVGYGTANCFEGTAAVHSLSNSLAAFRLMGGLTDSSDNVSDFILLAPSPRNSASPQNLPAENGVEDIVSLSEPPSSMLMLTALAALLWRRARSRERGLGGDGVASLGRAA